MKDRNKTLTYDLDLIVRRLLGHDDKVIDRGKCVDFEINYERYSGGAVRPPETCQSSGSGFKGHKGRKHRYSGKKKKTGLRNSSTKKSRATHDRIEQVVDGVTTCAGNQVSLKGGGDVRSCIATYVGWLTRKRRTFPLVSSE